MRVKLWKSLRDRALWAVSLLLLLAFMVFLSPFSSYAQE